MLVIFVQSITRSSPRCSCSIRVVELQRDAFRMPGLDVTIRHFSATDSSILLPSPYLDNHNLESQDSCLVGIASSSFYLLSQFPIVIRLLKNIILDTWQPTVTDS